MAADLREPDAGDAAGSGAGSEGSPLRRFWSAVAFPVTFFVALGAVVMVLSWFSSAHMDTWTGYLVKTPHQFRADHLFAGWMRYDAYWYTDISDHGYSYTPGAMSSVAFFPAYPLTMRLLENVTTDYVLAGILVTFTCGLAFAVLFYRWCCLRFSTAVSRLALVLLFVFPYAWYLFGAVYADAFFLTFTMAAFLLLEKDRPVLAGLAAAVATGARPVGVGVFVGLLAVEIERRGVIQIPYFDRARLVGWSAARRRSWVEPATASTVSTAADSASSAGDSTMLDAGADAAGTRAGAGADDAGWIRFRPGNAQVKDLGLLLSLGGLAAWCTYLWRTYGDPLLFTEIEGVPGWDQAQGPATWFKYHWFDLLRQYRFFVHDHVNSWDFLVYTTDVSFQAVLAFAFLLAVPLVIRRVGWGYAVYVLTVVGIPIIGTKDWQGTGRYLLGAFPVFVALAAWLIERNHVTLRRVLVGASAALFLFMTSAFARGYYLS